MSNDKGITFTPDEWILIFLAGSQLIQQLMFDLSQMTDAERAAWRAKEEMKLADNIEWLKERT